MADSSPLAAMVSAVPRPNLVPVVRPAVSEHAATTLHFGTFEVDLQSRELRKHGLRIRLAQKPFQILELLLNAGGQVVTRESLRKKLWPDTHVGYEHSLNTAVNTLRDLLGDSAHNPRYIETLPRLGYRFISPVTLPPSALRAQKKMLVVLPFENLSGDCGQDFFADGVTEEITAQIGQLSPKRLGVIARTSAALYKGVRKSVSEIAAELGVDYILEGSVRKSAKSVRITAQLIAATDQSHLWSASYDRELGDVLAVQSETARELAKSLAVELLPE
ncbi:MAG TPA: winged helix-turn-helix domain-containing protein [Candidatus Acidoferrum sp.]|jgi:TolB-like protein|nr:winged helix-turn-helix domain-containing protein [Candidatus Acidoferrum sp.]